MVYQSVSNHLARTFPAKQAGGCGASLKKTACSAGASEYKVWVGGDRWVKLTENIGTVGVQHFPKKFEEIVRVYEWKI